MLSVSSFGRSSPHSHYSRTFELPDDYEELYSRRDSDYGVGGAMLPIFLNDLRRNNQQQEDLVEVTLELEEDAIVLCSVTPTAPLSNHTGDSSDVPSGILGRSLSASSRLRRKFSWLTSGSSRTSSSDIVDRKISARDARRIKAKLERTRSSAQRGLKGLRFISKTTGVSDAEELWKKVASRFRVAG
ncbi:hypothetical protein Patl1_13660 [Pistacia atlantica]|uniref:Uncharacterized protein n=1 Tax=Pistacia atlantica TaxID=434234 RepID=A0ACC1AU97_9ROSI|nr:hypothetical protein Patl1_13660 [Pistacia atlantica]